MYHNITIKEKVMNLCKCNLSQDTKEGMALKQLQKDIIDIWREYYNHPENVLSLEQNINYCMKQLQCYKKHSHNISIDFMIDILDDLTKIVHDKKFTQTQSILFRKV